MPPIENRVVGSLHLLLIVSSPHTTISTIPTMVKHVLDHEFGVPSSEFLDNSPVCITSCRVSVVISALCAGSVGSVESSASPVPFCGFPVGAFDGSFGLGDCPDCAN